MGTDSAGDGPAARPDRDRAVVAGLRRRTDEVLAAAPAPVTAEEAAFDRAVVVECRYLMRLLSSRRRSEGEMRERLRQREVPRDVAHETIARTRRAGLIDDAAFARDWVAQRRQLRGLSDEALRRELEAKRVALEDIATALALGVEDEEERARRLVRDRLVREERALADDADGSVRGRVARRLDAHLGRKGYDGALALRVISTELRALTGR
ncbi:regulatory protein RecX [Brachybacterium nesterenkovii]|uniref:regulatory protein RecX n=1 Tax=Brachybacterium nesterenkovii TaxID=47847 RepID=UPI001F1F0A5D|nr:regulatory protein RecX [Brachybacterium nesterenkovii]